MVYVLEDNGVYEVSTGFDEEGYDEVFRSAMRLVSRITSVKRLCSVFWCLLFIVPLFLVTLFYTIVDPNTLLTIVNVCIGVIVLLYLFYPAREYVGLITSIYDNMYYTRSQWIDMYSSLIVYLTACIVVVTLHLGLAVYYVVAKPVSYYIIEPCLPPIEYLVHILSIASMDPCVAWTRTSLYIVWSILVGSLSYQYYRLYRDFNVYEYLLVSWIIILAGISYILFILSGSIDYLILLIPLFITKILILLVDTRDIELQLLNKIFPLMLEVEKLYHKDQTIDLV